MASVKRRTVNGKPARGGKPWRARYRDADGKMHERLFATSREAKDWANAQETAVRESRHVAPRDAKMTLGEWCDVWLDAYGSRAESTVRQARTHVARIKATPLGQMRLGDIRPIDVQRAVVGLRDDYASSYVRAVHSRLRSILASAIRNGLLHRNPAELERGAIEFDDDLPESAPATTAQVWSLYDAMPDNLRVAVLLGAFAGLRVAEICGLRVEDINLDEGHVFPRVQYPAKALKSKSSRARVPVPPSMADHLRGHLARYGIESGTVLRNQWGEQVHPRVIERWWREARKLVHASDPTLSPSLRFHDLRHFFASYLIAGGADVKVVQARMRHASATVTLNTYTHLWPDRDETTRDLVDEAFAGRSLLRAV